MNLPIGIVLKVAGAIIAIIFVFLLGSTVQQAVKKQVVAKEAAVAVKRTDKAAKVLVDKQRKTQSMTAQKVEQAQQLRNEEPTWADTPLPAGVQQFLKEGE